MNDFIFIWEAVPPEIVGLKFRTHMLIYTFWFNTFCVVYIRANFEPSLD